MFERGDNGGVQLTVRGAIVSWTVVVLIVVLVGAYVLGLFSFGSQAGAGHGSQGGASQSGGVQSGGIQLAAPTSDGQSGDVVMSGRYPVSPEGKLLRPLDAPQPVEPLLPAAALVESPEGMEAFARYSLDTVSYMWMSGDTKPLEKITLSTCSWCDDLIKDQVTRNENGGWIDSGKIDLLATGQAFVADESQRVWHLDIEIEQLPMLAYDGNVLHDYAADKGTMSIEAQYVDGQWKLYEAGILK